MRYSSVHSYNTYTCLLLYHDLFAIWQCVALISVFALVSHHQSTYYAPGTTAVRALLGASPHSSTSRAKRKKIVCGSGVPVLSPRAQSIVYSIQERRDRPTDRRDRLTYRQRCYTVPMERVLPLLYWCYVLYVLHVLVHCCTIRTHVAQLYAIHYLKSVCCSSKGTLAAAIVWVRLLLLNTSADFLDQQCAHCGLSVHPIRSL